MASAPSEDSDQPGHPLSLIRVFAVLYAQWVAKDPSFFQANSEDSDQTGRMPRLIWVFAGRTCHFVGFVTMRLTLLSGYITMLPLSLSNNSLWLSLRFHDIPCRGNSRMVETPLMSHVLLVKYGNGERVLSDASRCNLLFFDNLIVCLRWCHLADDSAVLT